MQLSIPTNDLYIDPLTGQALFKANNDWHLTQLIKQGLQSALNYLHVLSTDAAFATKMSLTFGRSWNPEVAQLLTQQWLSNDFHSLPRIEIRPSAEINGANGAFAGATNTIYLSYEFVAQNLNNRQAITTVLLEEIGHYLDWRLNTSDAPGDEGAIFAALAQGIKPNEKELLSLKAEDDSATIILNDQEIAVEQAVPIVTLLVTDSYAVETLSGKPVNSGGLIVKRNVVTNAPLTVFYHVGGTATNGSDYNGLSGSVVIPKGKAIAPIPITLKNDLSREVTEQVTLTLKDGSNYNPGAPKTGTVSIIDNDTTVIITDPDPNSPGPGFPNNLTPDETYKVTYDKDNNAWETATKRFDGTINISVTDDPYFDGSADELFPIDETYILRIKGSLGFAQETYTVNEAIGTATIALSPTSKIKTATFNIQDDDWNNSFSKAISLNKVGGDFGEGSPISSNSTNVGATKQSGEPNHAGNSGGASVWWKWKATESGGVDISASSFDFKTVLSVYTGTSVSNLTEIASNSNDGPVSFDVVTGTTYYIAVDGNNTGTTVETGDIFLDFTPRQQTFNQFDALPLSIPDLGTVTSALSVNGLSGTVADVNLDLDITHTYDADLDVFLISPTGTRVAMFQDVGGSDDNFTFTTFNDEAATSISSGAAPFTDSFKPQELLSTFDGQNPNGTWTLEITDDNGTDIGTLNNWSLSLSLTTA